MRRSKILTLALGASLALAGCAGSPAATATGTPDTTTPSAAASAVASPAAASSAEASPSVSSSAAASSEASAPASASAAAAGPVEVAIQDFKFEPAEVQVAAGQTVSWTNEDGEPHTVRSEDGSISSAFISGQPFTWTAEGEPGTEIPYICSIHPTMKGTVTIVP